MSKTEGKTEAGNGLKPLSEPATSFLRVRSSNFLAKLINIAYIYYLGE